MERKVIFTICAKNYLAQAKVLGNSVKKYCPDCDFYLVLSDEIDGQNILCEDFEVIESKDLGIDGFYDMAFKYDVIEFSTAVKPFFIEKLFEKYDKVLYLDPDMVVYHSLDNIFLGLEDSDVLLTPHLIKPYIKFNGATPEEALLFVGIFNLGFCAIKNSETGRYITEWWMEKLRNQCYADKEDGLHVDQKWMDFLPSLYPGKIHIVSNPGVNIAFWNFHERHLTNKNGKFFVDEAPLSIFHFSSFNPLNIEAVAGRQSKFTLSSLPEYRPLYQKYLEDLKENGLDYHLTQSYKYNTFEDGTPLLKYHRRLYRGLVREGYSCQNHFSTGPNSFFEMLKANNAMLVDNQGELKVLKKSYGTNPPIFKYIFKLLILFKTVFGVKKYYLMMRFFSIYHRFENQTFLIKNRR